MQLTKIVSCSDLHFAHPKVPIGKIIRSFRVQIFKELEDAQLLFIAGDVFDKTMQIDSLDAQEALGLISDLLEFAKARNIKIRILRGTFTHDRKQTVLFDTLNKRINADLLCVDNLQLEYIEDFDLRILYIPDNLPQKESEEIVESAKQLMDSVKWTNVDFVVGHGYFEHVLPKGLTKEPARTFRAHQFSFVKEFVLMGHVHTHSRHKNIIYHGSFERLCHGEEEHKGFLVLTKEQESWKCSFVINTDSTPFYTVHPKGNTVDELVESMHAQVKKKFGPFPFGHLRISVENPEYRQVLIQNAIFSYDPNVVVTGITVKDEKKESTVIDEHQFQTLEQVTPTEDNIAELVFLHIQKIKGESPLCIEEIRATIDTP